jgi:hypothetical protein
MKKDESVQVFHESGLFFVNPLAKKIGLCYTKGEEKGTPSGGLYAVFP